MPGGGFRGTTQSSYAQQLYIQVETIKKMRVAQHVR